MENFYKKIVAHPGAILFLFVSFAILGAAGGFFIEVNYDMNDYLPPDSPSTLAVNKMYDEYGGGIPNARAMISNVTVGEALKYKSKIEKINGVNEIRWLDDAVDLQKPLYMYHKDKIDTYYKGGKALFLITISKEERIQAVKKVRKIIGHRNSLTGSAVSMATSTNSSIKEISVVAIIGVLFAFLILIITTSSWLEPFIILGGLGIAILINSGSNLMFGEISFVTNAACNILQLAVSLDYSVFLLHRFHMERKITENPKEAMIKALVSSTDSIISSGMTTFIGFLALCLMRFQVGPDLGLALAKGVIISLVTVFIFMPPFILSTDKWIDRYKHKSFLPSFRRLGRFVLKTMIPCMCLFFIIVVPAYLASNSNNYYFGSSHIFGAETRLGKDRKNIETTFGENDNYVLMIPRQDIGKEKVLSQELHKIPQVKSIISYVDSVGAEIPQDYVPDRALNKLNSKNYTRMIISLDTAYEGKNTFSLVKKIRKIGEKYYPGKWYLAGEGVSTYDLKNTVMDDMIKVNVMAILAVFIVLVLSMKSIFLPVLLVVGIETAICINMAVPYFTDSNVFYIAYLIITSLQLGATVDYAILLTERYKEVRQTYKKKEAVIETLSQVTASIITSGSALTVVGLLMGRFSTHGLLSQLGYFLGKGTICSLIIVLFVLPGLLYLTDKIIEKTSRGIDFCK